MSYRPSRSRLVPDGPHARVRALMEGLERRFDAGTRAERYFELLLIQLDQVRAIDEALGSARGSAIIRRTATRIREQLPGKVPLCDFRDGRFAVLLPRDTPAVSASLMLGAKILESFGEPLKLGRREVPVTVSIGLAASPEDGRRFGDLVRRADLALSYARRRGGSRLKHHDEQMSARVRRRWTVTSDLKRAFKAGEFSLVYQPIMDGVALRICGAEALIRWEHPKRGTQSPGEFVPLLEESGLIIAVGAWVLETACRQAQAWRARGLEFVELSVNLSTRQLEEPGLATLVPRLLSEIGLPPRCLKLEITESELLRDPRQTEIVINALAAAGVRVVIDDFATGYSSMSYLKQLPVAGLKIDRSFVSGLPRDSRDVAISLTIMDLARRFGLETTAEGVETRAQAEFLQYHGVHRQQGYLFGRGVDGEQFTRLLEQPAGARDRVRTIDAALEQMALTQTRV